VLGHPPIFADRPKVLAHHHSNLTPYPRSWDERAPIPTAALARILRCSHLAQQNVQHRVQQFFLSKFSREGVFTRII
jgi:hypothetical protein